MNEEKTKIYVDLEEYINLRQTRDVFHKMIELLEMDFSIDYGDRLHVIGGENITAFYKMFYPYEYQEIYKKLMEKKENGEETA